MTARHEKNCDEEAVPYEEALEKAGSGMFQYFIILVGGFILFSSYVSVATPAFILPAAQCDLNMDSETKGRLASAGFVGLIISCHFWGFLSDTLGRRYIIIRCLLADAILYFVTSVTPYYQIILVLRLINGFASSGAVVSIFAYVGEFIIDKNRTKSIMIVSMVASFAYFITPLYAWLTIPGKWSFELYPGMKFKPWRLYYAVSGLPSLISALMIYFLPESPKFLLAKGRVGKTIEILRRIHTFNRKNEEEEYLVKNIKVNENEKVAKLGDDTNKVIAFLRLMWNQTAPLFKEPHRLNIALVCLSQFLMYFSNGGLFLWLPETMNRLAKFRDETHNEQATFCEVVEYENQPSVTNLTEKLLGENFRNSLVTTATSKIIERTCSEEVNIIVFTYLGTLGIIQTVNLGCIAAISKICHKKIILLLLPTFSLLALFSLQFFHRTDFAAYNSCLVIIFTGAAIPVINSVVVELFPTNLRAMAGCLTLMCCRLGTVTTNIIAGVLIDHHCKEFVWCFIVSMIMCLITLGIMPTKLEQRKEVKNSMEIS